LATQLGREMKVPMHMANLALDEFDAALNRGLGEPRLGGSRCPPAERAGIKDAVPEPT